MFGHKAMCQIVILVLHHKVILQIVIVINLKIIKTTPVSILILKSKGFIDFSYISKDEEGNIVTRMLTFSDINYRIRISIIYRESEKYYWENSIKYFLNSINIK